MSFTKNRVLEVLKTLTSPGEGNNLVDSEKVDNIQIFGNELIVDVSISNPTLQARKRMEVDIMKAIHDQINPKIIVKVNVKVSAKDNSNPANPQIKGKKINNISNIIAVASGKGGVGKSTIAVNLAVTLAKMGLKTGILDADIYGPSVPMMLDVQGKRPLAVKIDGKSKMVPVENHGVKTLSIGFFTETNQAVVWRGPMASKALNQMIFDAHWGDLDFLIVDLPPGTGDIHLSILQSLSLTGAVIVSTPQNVALADAKKGIAMFRQESINVPVIGLIENMAYFVAKELPNNKYYLFGKDGGKFLAEDLDIPLLGQVPIEQSIRESGDFGSPAALQEGTFSEQIFQDITKSVINQTIKRNQDLPPSEVVKITNMSGCLTKK